MASRDIIGIVITPVFFGVLFLWVVPHPIAYILFEYKAFWMLSIIAISIWLAICSLWILRVHRIVKRAEGSAYFERIQRIKSEHGEVDMIDS